MAKIKEHWVKKTPYGDYNETPDRVNARTNRNVHIVREAKALMLNGKHAGSKPIKRILASLARAHEAQAKIKQE